MTWRKKARFVAPNAAVRADFDVSAAALPLVELAGKVAEVGLENPRLFQCAVAALRLMDKAAAGTIGAENAVVVGCADRARILCAACLLKELAFAGFRPSLAHCAVCGEPLSFAAPSSAFSPHEGGCLCDACAAAGERFSSHRCCPSCVLARDLLHRPFADVVALSAPSSHVKGVLRIVQDLAEEHVGSRLKVGIVFAGRLGVRCAFGFFLPKIMHPRTQTADSASKLCLARGIGRRQSQVWFRLTNSLERKRAVPCVQAVVLVIAPPLARMGQMSSLWGLCDFLPLREFALARAGCVLLH